MCCDGCDRGRFPAGAIEALATRSRDYAPAPAAVNSKLPTRERVHGEGDVCVGRVVELEVAPGVLRPQDAPEMRVRGTVRGAGDTLVRSCQTQQVDCTVQGGYTCDYSSCVSYPVFVCRVA